jgi:uncharacterized repeat protein (TIGR03803 family)
MNIHSKNLFLLRAMIAGQALMLVGQAAAQTFTALHHFSALSGRQSTNSDGAFPEAGLILSGDTLYGVTDGGGSYGVGAVFKVNTNGTGFTILHSFTGGSGGDSPDGALILTNNTLFGTTSRGGVSQAGTIFAINTDGTGFTKLYDLGTGTDGAQPVAALILSGSTLYGTTPTGGDAGKGTVFAINTDGTGYTNLHSFTDLNNNTNSDGANPYAGVVLVGDALYGVAAWGGKFGDGTVFAVNTNGTGFTILHDFNDHGDGAEPQGTLIASGDTLYGPTTSGGPGLSGTVFAINTDGTGFRTLHGFTHVQGNEVNSDGYGPAGGLVLLEDTLCGTAQRGGDSGYGTVFAVNTNGTDFAVLHHFPAVSWSGYPDYLNTNTDGVVPYAGLTMSGNTLYGTAQEGGSSAEGTVFSLLVPPQLKISAAAANLILKWPSRAAAAFTLQSAPALDGPFTNISGATSPYTNPIAAPQQFFRLIPN